MDAVRSMLWSLGIVFGAAVPAVAQTGREDNSGVFVWAFLGLCALIVVAQLIPAIMMLAGSLKAAFRGLKGAEKRQNGIITEDRS